LVGQPEEIPDANFTTEIRAGLTTFATMAYIIAVNVSPLSAYKLRFASNPIGFVNRRA